MPCIWWNADLVNWMMRRSSSIQIVNDILVHYSFQYRTRSVVCLRTAIHSCANFFVATQMVVVRTPTSSLQFTHAAYRQLCVNTITYKLNPRFAYCCISVNLCSTFDALLRINVVCRGSIHSSGNRMIGLCCVSQKSSQWSMSFSSKSKNFSFNGCLLLTLVLFVCWNRCIKTQFSTFCAPDSFDSFSASSTLIV